MNDKVEKSIGKEMKVGSRTSLKGASPIHAPFRLNSILAPIDFSEASEKTLLYAVAFARQFGGRITMVHVVEPPMYPDWGYAHLSRRDHKLKVAAKEKLDELRSTHSSAADVLDETIVLAGDAFSRIAELARKKKFDLILLSTHGHTGLKHALLGSTTEKVVRYAPCPVLVVREQERDFIN